MVLCVSLLFKESQGVDSQTYLSSDVKVVRLVVTEDGEELREGGVEVYCHLGLVGREAGRGIGETETRTDLE